MQSCKSISGMSPTKACFTITTYRKVSFTDQIFYRWSGFNDPTVRRTLSSTAQSHEVRQYKWSTPKHKSPVDTKTFVIEWQAPAMCRESPYQKAARGLCFLWCTKSCLIERMTFLSNWGQRKGPQIYSMPLIQGNPVINLHNFIASPSGYFLLLSGFVFSPYVLQLLAEVYATTGRAPHSWHSVWGQHSHYAHVHPPRFWFVLFYVIQIWQKPSNLTNDNVILGQYVAFWVTF